MLQNIFESSRELKGLRTNQDLEYLADQFKEICDEKGIKRQNTIPKTP